MSDPNVYDDPLTGRYASAEMSRIFSPASKFGAWRRLWIWLAEEEKKLGLPVTDEAIAQMHRHVETIDFEAAAKFERETRHDVMAHVKTYGLAAPAAAGIIHWGATSAYVSDNGDLLQMREALALLERRIASFLRRLGDFAKEHRSLACLAYTHFQTAQPTTVGKRACLWAQDFLWDLQEVRRVRENLRFLGAKGATGTQASFLALFDGDGEKVEKLDSAVTERAGFAKRQTVSGQTYSRKQDAFVLAALSGFAQSAHKCATDLRLLQHEGEIAEPFGKAQIGSSAMPYKRNPMRAERVCAIARHVIALSLDPAFTAATQWLERTLDDSANKRLSIPPAFLCADAIALILDEIFDGIEVREHVIGEHLDAELPFLAMENVLMEAVKRGRDRQAVHETLRLLAMSWREAKERTGRTDLSGWLQPTADETGLTLAEVDAAARRNLTGRAAEQVDGFLEELDAALKGVEAAAPEGLRV
ncbi:MAG TPA: adenylosuccinate lyase [Thermoanaerobaculia bacterium]|nr:adenylosuccinate lyase [Thermoanaerobaculia bacterium]